MTYNVHVTSLARKLLAGTTSGLLLAAGLAATASPAHANDKTVFKVVGTTDVFDSHLIQDVIEPDFEAKYPDLDLQYISQGTGQAITTAKSGAASALLVHAAALENQFVGDGYSLEQYGRAIFWGDYVLLGPAADPAGVMSGADPSHDVVDAFQKIAAAGSDGKAVFVSRASNPGTTVQEHAIWALTSGVPLCTVPTSKGGGKAPGATDGGTCSDYTNNSSDTAYPAWYRSTGGAGQAQNINIANTCGAAVGGNGANCYAFTDRGTFNYLQSTGQAQNLEIVARDNAASAPGGAALLVNSFHAYAINPDAVPAGSNIDKKNAVRFLDFLTSPSEQAKIGQYLGTGRAAGFIPSATPNVTVSALPTRVDNGTVLPITGSISNATPGTPPLNGVTVKLYGSVGGGADQLLDTDVTNAAGGFSFSTTVTGPTRYSVVVPDITKVEDSSLSPPFGDILQGGTTDIGTVQSLLSSSVTITSNAGPKGYVVVKGTISPKAGSGKPKVRLFLAKPGTALHQVSGINLKNGASTFIFKLKHGKGTFDYQVHYLNDGVIVESTAPNPPGTLKVK